MRPWQAQAPLSRRSREEVAVGCITPCHQVWEAVQQARELQQTAGRAAQAAHTCTTFKSVKGEHSHAQTYTWALFFSPPSHDQVWEAVQQAWDHHTAGRDAHLHVSLSRTRLHDEACRITEQKHSTHNSRLAGLLRNSSRHAAQRMRCAELPSVITAGGFPSRSLAAGLSLCRSQ